MSNRQTTWELKAVDNLPETIAKMQKIAELMQQQQNLSTNSTAAIIKQLADITKGYDNLQSTMQGVLKGQQDNTKAAADAANAAKQATDASLKAANEARAARQAERAQLQQIQQQYESMRSTVQGLATITAGVFAAKQVKEYATEIIDAQSRLELFGQTLTNIYQNSQKASVLVAGAINLEQKSPFNLEQIIEATQRMAAMGVESEKLLTYLESLGNISSLVGLQKLPLLAKALTDVRSKQILYAQEIRQFTDNGVPLYDLLATSMNKTREEVVKLAQDHKISFAEVEKAIISASAVGGRYYKAMETQAASLAGQVSNLESAFTYAKARIGDFFEGTLAKGIGVVKDLTNYLFGSESAIKRTYEGAKTAAAGWLTYQLALITVNTALRANGVANLAAMAQLQGQTIATVGAATATGALRTAWTGLTLAFRANPIGLIVTALSLLVTGLMAAKTVTEEVNLVTDTATDSLRKEKIEMTAAFQAAMFHEQGTDMRKTAIASLTAKYPELLKYTNQDAVSNTTLNRILERQIGLLDTKIKYAGAAARVDALYEKSVENAKAQFEVISKLRGEYTEFSKAHQDTEKFLEWVMITQKSARGEYSKDVKEILDLQVEQLKLNKQMQGANVDLTLSQQKQSAEEIKVLNQRMLELRRFYRDKKITDEDYEQSYKKLEVEIKKVSGELDKEVAKENDRWKKISANLKFGTDAYEKAFEEHNKKLADIKGEEYASFAKNEDAKKAKAIFTAKELDVLAKGIRLDTLKDQLELIEAQKKLEIEQVNYSKKTRTEAAAAIKEIVAKAEAEKKALIEKYGADREKLLRENLAVAESTIQEETISSHDLLEAKKFDDKEAVKSKKEANKAIREDNKKTKEEETELQKQVSAIHKMEAEIAKNQADIERDAQKDRIKMAFDYLGAQEGIMGQLSKMFKRAFEDIDLLNGKTVAGYEADVAAARAHFAEISKIYEAGSDMYKKAADDVVDKEKKLEEAKAAALKAKTAAAMMVLELLETAKTAIVGTVTEANKAIAAVMLKVRDAMKSLYDDLIRMSETALNAQLESNKDALTTELAASKASFAEKKKIVEDYYAKQTTLINNFYATQKRLAESRDAIDAQLTFNARMLEINTETTTKISSAWDLSKGPLGPQTLLKVLTAWKEHNAQLKAAAFEREAYEQQLAINRLEFEKEKARELRDIKIAALKEERDAYVEAKEAEIDAAAEAADAKIEVINTTLDTVKDAYNKEVDAVKDAYSKQLDALKEKQSAEEAALRATYDLKQQLLEQGTNDEIEAIAILDRTRNEALERYRTAEVARLTATRDRILATLTDEAERAAVTADYARQIQGVHSEVEEAKLDKSKGVSLATKQLRAEEKDESIRLKGEEKTAIEKLQDDYQIQFKKLADDRDVKLADMATANKKREGELKDDIKKIQTDLADEIRRLKGLIDAKDAEMNNSMKSANADYANSVNNANRQIFEATKKMKIAELMAEIAILRGKRNLFNKGKIDGYIDDINAAIGTIQGINFDALVIGSGSGSNTPVTGGGGDPGSGSNPTNPEPGNPNPEAPKTEQYFAGTPYIEGLGYPDGRDTVPAMVNKGERVMQTHLNALIGGRDVSNEELAAKKLFADKVLGRVADIRGMLKRDTFLAPLPEYMLKGNGSSNLDAFAEKLSIMASGGTANLEELAEKIAALINKPSVSINVSPRGMSVREKGQQQQNETYYNNTHYKNKLP